MTLPKTTSVRPATSWFTASRVRIAATLDRAFPIDILDKVKRRSPMIQLLTHRVRHLAGCRVCRQRLLTGSPHPIERDVILPVLPTPTAAAGQTPDGGPYIPDGGVPLASELRAA
jgi:hypothetical protein